MTTVDIAVDNGLSEEWALTSFDPWDNRLNHGNAWALYDLMRRTSPAIRSNAHAGLWVLTRYADVKRAALDHETFSSVPGTWIGVSEDKPQGIPIDYDPPAHSRFRAPMIAPFTPRRIGQFVPMVRGYVDRILDALEARGVADVVADIAEPTAVSVISEIIGYDSIAAARNRELSVRVVTAPFAERLAANSAHQEFIRGELRKSLKDPGDGLLGQLATAERYNDFTEDEMVGIIQSFGLAGHHTTINAIASMLIFATDTDVRERWLPAPDDTRAVRRFVEEVLRLDPPIHLEGRWTTAATWVDGVEIPAGSQVCLLFAAANRDGAQFGDPAAFNPERPATHLSFGHGIHTCLGMALARLEMAVVFEEILRRFPTLRAVGAPIDSGMVFGHHMGWDSVPVAVSSASATPRRW